VHGERLVDQPLDVGGLRHIGGDPRDGAGCHGAAAGRSGCRP
jgi:hypothetical protein